MFLLHLYFQNEYNVPLLKLQTLINFNYLIDCNQLSALEKNISEKSENVVVIHKQAAANLVANEHHHHKDEKTFLFKANGIYWQLFPNNLMCLG